MSYRGNDIEGRADAAGVCGLDHHDEFSLRIATVDLRARQRFDCARGFIEVFRSCPYEDTRDFDSVRRSLVVPVRPSAIHEFAAVDTARYRRFRHGVPHFDGGPGGPMIAW